MPKSGTAMSKASIPYLMADRTLGLFCSVEVGACIIVITARFLHRGLRFRC